MLRLIAERDSAVSAELARELDLSPALVRSSLEQLERQGYLEVAVSGCADPCARCPTRQACLPGNQARTWSLTAKGRSALADHGP
jgi:predicted ArsR family transcriptional regulator